MKASELMIGDWVRVKPHKGYYEGITQVLGIPDRSTLKHNGHVDVELHYFDEIENCDSYEVEDCEDRHIEPIPLTVDMLEENGFFIDHIDMGGQYEMYDGKVKCENIQQIGDHWETSYSSITFKYVHEFQHYLRLIHNDLADNFKVN